MTKREILFTKIHERDGKRYKATTWDCTPPGHEDTYTLRRTEWELLPEVTAQLDLF
jgi:hypothetical protein